MSERMTRRNALKAAGVGAAALAVGMNTSCAAEPHRNPLPAAMALPGAYAKGSYTLPKLPYAYDALAPLHEERTLRIHHDKHHAGYVKGLNKTLDALNTARRKGNYGHIKALSRALAFHGSGHVLHTIYWNSMTPGGAEVPDSLGSAMRRSFGSVDAGKKQFAAATKAVEGSGWGVLAYEPLGGQLMVLQAEKHQNLTVWGVVPLMVCDVWEHAYYLQFANNRGAWVDNFMKLANWPFAAKRLQMAIGEHTDKM
jgi:Fe-Mn family superoxide dismutase